MNTGCTPTKAMVASAKVAHMASDAARFGIHLEGHVQVSLAEVKSRGAKIIQNSRQSLGKMLANAGCTVVYGQARFVTPHEIQVGEEILRGERIFIDVGARAAIPKLPGLENISYLTNSSLLELEELPKHLVIVGGGAVGVEFAQMFRGGAAVYVAEHVEDGKRGFYTSFIQITATLGLFISLAVILATQQSMSPATFQRSGWRLPFLLSLVLVCISLYIRIRMKESPIFTQLKSTGMHSAKPLTDAFTKWSNLRLVLISLFGATAGQGVIWYTSQFYALFYLQTILRVNAKTANIIVAVALLAAMPFFTVFGFLSDKVGRKKLMMAALLLSIIFYMPIYKGMQQAAGNHVVAVSSVKDRVTGAIKLTPLAQESSSGKLVPAPEADHVNRPVLILLIFLQVIFVCMIYGPTPDISSRSSQRRSGTHVSLYPTISGMEYSAGCSR